MPSSTSLSMCNLPDRSVPPPLRRVARAAWLVLGLVFIALGFIGAFLPLMPTTIFLILAAGCFARSSARLEAWLLGHPRFGPTLRAWRNERSIPPNAKRAACAGMALGFILFALAVHPHFWLAFTVAIFLAGCAAYVVTRPQPGSDRDRGTLCE